MQAKEYYKILGVPEDADTAVIKKAYRKIARESHPDQNPGDTVAEERFKSASEAYEILSNPEKREKYDALRRYGFGRAGFGPGGHSGEGFQGFDPRGGGFRVHFDSRGPQGVDFAEIFNDGSQFSELFEQIFAQAGMRHPGAGGGHAPGNGHRFQARPQQPQLDDFFRQDGADVHCTIWLRVDQLEKGAKVKVKTPRGNKVLLTIPAGTRIGAVLRVPGMGLNGPAGAGDQYVHVEGVA